MLHHELTSSIAADYEWLLREFHLAKESGFADESLARARKALAEGVALPPREGALNSLSSWMECLVTAQVDGPVVNNSAVANSILPPAARYTLPSNYFGAIGKAAYIKAVGRLSTTAGSAGTGQVIVNFGTLASPIGVFSPAAFALSGTATNLTWMLDIMLTCRTIGTGANATLMGVGIFQSVGLSAASGQALLPASAPAVGTGFDSTITNVVDLQWAFNTANLGNSIQLHEYALLSYN